MNYEELIKDAPRWPYPVNYGKKAIDEHFRIGMPYPPPPNNRPPVRGWDAKP